MPVLDLARHRYRPVTTPGQIHLKEGLLLSTKNISISPRSMHESSDIYTYYSPSNGLLKRNILCIVSLLPDLQKTCCAFVMVRIRSQELRT